MHARDITFLFSGIARNRPLNSPGVGMNDTQNDSINGPASCWRGAARHRVRHRYSHPIASGHPPRPGSSSNFELSQRGMRAVPIYCYSNDEKLRPE